MATIEFLRQFRIGGYAIFDFVASFVVIYLLAPLLSKLFLKIKLQIPKKSWVFLTLPIGILTHLLVGSITPMTKNFIDLNGHYILKLVMLALIIFGIKDIRVVKK